MSVEKIKKKESVFRRDRRYKFFFPAMLIISQFLINIVCKTAIAF